MDEKEWLEGLLEACESEIRGTVGAVAAYMRGYPGDALSTIAVVRMHFLADDSDDDGDDD